MASASLSPNRHPVSRPVLQPHRQAGQWAAVIGLILAAAFFRLRRLDELPPAVSYDEAYNGIEAQRILRLDSYRPIFFEANGLGLRIGVEASAGTA